MTKTTEIQGANQGFPKPRILHSYPKITLSIAGHQTYWCANVLVCSGLVRSGVVWKINKALDGGNRALVIGFSSRPILSPQKNTIFKGFQSLEKLP